jgi:hypothetical protein
LHGETSRKATLDQTPARREINIALRQRPDGVDMIRQDAYRDRIERTASLNSPIDLPKTINLLHKQIVRTFGKNDREEEDAAFEFGSTVLRHNELCDL